jgi:asparagine synthase (glutamine-hydrolysing)
MCGIFAYFGIEVDVEALKPHFFKIQHRGPDASDFKTIVPGLHFGFHRLAINGLTPAGNQPMHIDGCWLVANAEIFNYRELAKAHNIKLSTGSDCEIIIHLYRKKGLTEMLRLLDGEFAFLLFDELNGELFAARDHLGVRGMYQGENHCGDIAWASEAKALVFMDNLQHFPPGHWYSGKTKRTSPFYEHRYARHDIQPPEAIQEQIRFLLGEAVQKRMLSERPIGCLLSGGLDSSLIAALVARHHDKPWPLETFSVGLSGSPDLYYARKVADYIGSKHHSFEMEESDFLALLEETVYITGSFDVTTIRASVGHILVSKLVRQHSDVKVLFTGETIDECGSYLYFQQAPSAEAFQEEAVRLLRDIHYFDMLRGDRSISQAGLEARVPFADKTFLQFYMGIDPALRMFNDERIEKYLLRKAFESDKLLPKEVLWRRKNGFSDSVSPRNRSWSDVIQEYVDSRVSDQDFETGRKVFVHDPPKTKEAYFYRCIFRLHYGHHQSLTPYQWLPRWCGDMADPSARKLSLYQAD